MDPLRRSRSRKIAWAFRVKHQPDGIHPQLRCLQGIVETGNATDLDPAAQWIHRVPAFVTVVGLFLNADPAFVDDVLAEIDLDMLQFHGVETPADCQRHQRPYIKALGMGGAGTDVLAQARSHAHARGMLLDSHAPGEAGGRGLRFAWAEIPTERPLPLILAGGLDATNVADAVRQVRPWAVDVSSGVECAPGIKDPQRMREFMERIRRADAEA
jgi:phosphoribosylanthranilate isomerase